MATSDAFLKVLGGFAALALAALVVAGLPGQRPGPELGQAQPLAPPTARFALSLSPDGRSIALEGEIDFGVTAALGLLLESAPEVGLLRLGSGGGLVAEARGLAGLVERFSLATAAFGDCASACTLVFIAGRGRALEPGARLGFHSYAQLSPLVGLLRDPAQEQERDLARFRAAGVAEDFLQRILLTPHSAMWFPSRQELQDAGVVDADVTSD